MSCQTECGLWRKGYIVTETPHSYEATTHHTHTRKVPENM